MIDPTTLREQLNVIERMRVEGDLQEAANALRAAQLEAVRLGIRMECENGCGRAITVRSKTRKCSRCLRTEWQRKARKSEARS